MSESFEIHSSIRDYAVETGPGTLDAWLGANPEALVLCDQRLLGHWDNLKAQPRVIAVPADEDRKNLGSVAEIIESMRDAGANRQSHMLAVGGGVVQDLATFAASVYMRGIDWTYCPTTLLGMVDSCVGGKSSINVGEYKNIVGNYYPPARILIDPVFCRTLPVTQRIAGLCEAAKICFASDDETFRNYLGLVAQGDLFADESRLARLVSLSLRAKKGFIEEDEFDHGIRLLLNFGHTFGHALEGASGFALSHGVAVGVGVLAAIDFSRRIGLADGSHRRTRDFVAHVQGLLACVPGLDAVLDSIDAEEALRRFRSDKKHQRGHYAVILVDPQGVLTRRLVTADASTDAQIVRSFSMLKGLIHEVQ